MKPAVCGRQASGLQECAPRGGEPVADITFAIFKQDLQTQCIALVVRKASGIAAGPSAEAVAEADEFLLDEIFHDLGLIASYTTSALEAAKRGDREELRLRLRVQLRDCFHHAVEVHNLLPPVRPKDCRSDNLAGSS